MATRRFDLGVLRLRRAPPGLTVLGAPSLATRAVWTLGALGGLLFLWSVAVTAGWVEGGWPAGGAGPPRLLRAPSLAETPLWLLPLALAALAGAVAAGGTRLALTPAGLDLSGPGRRRHFALADLRYARFWEEPRGHEALYAVRFVFADAEVAFAVPHRALWLALRARFLADPRGG